MFGDVTFAQAPFAALGGATFGRTVSETASVEAQSSFIYLSGGLVLESASGLDTEYSANNSLKSNIAEAASALTTQAVIANMLGAQAEAASGLDAPNFAASILNASQAEFASALDSPSVIATLLAFAEEAVSALDIPNGGRGFVVAIEENASAENTQTASVIFTGTVEELASAVDSISAIANINANVTGIQLYVNIGNVLIWAVIDDTQNPNWQNITNTQTPGWTDIPS